MKLGCFLSLLLFPVFLVIWAKKKQQRLATMPPEKRKQIENRDKYGKIDPSIECIYCKNTHCVRTRIDMADSLYRAVTKKKTYTAHSLLRG